MDLTKTDNSVMQRIQAMNQRVSGLQEQDLYFYNQPVSELRGGARVIVNGREMGMYASYSYLGLVGHPRINAAAREAVDRYGTGTHGVRTLAGTLDLHRELEDTIAEFKQTEAAITYTSGYVTNLTVVSTMLGRGDYVISDKLNHASIVDGCLMSGAKFLRFRHNDMDALEKRLQQVPSGAAKLVVADAVFSMDGDIIDFPKMVELCQKYEETIPSVGGYIAGKKEVINYLRHASRAYIFSAALPPAQAAAAKASFEVILDEPWRVEKLNANTRQFISGLKAYGFDTLQTETAIVPVICGNDEKAFAMTRAVQREGTFVLPVVSPAVPPGLARLRATVTAAHEAADIEQAMDVIARAGKKIGVI